MKDAIPDIKTSGINDVLIGNHKKITTGITTIYKKYGLKRACYDIVGGVLMISIYPVLLMIAVYSNIPVLLREPWKLQGN